MSNLQQIRKRAGLSQSQLAEQSDVSLRMIQKYETGVKNINNASVSTVIRLAKALNVDVESLLDERRKSYD